MSGEWRIAGEPAGSLPKVGVEYVVRHSRKGTFRARVVAVCGEWLDVVVTSGVARAVMQYNVAEEGDPVTIRDVHTHLAEVLP